MLAEILSILVLKRRWCGLIGEDSSGEKLLQLLREAKIGAQGVIKKKGFSTIRKSRIIARTQQVVRVDRELPIAWKNLF